MPARERGKCEGCGKHRALRAIDSGQKICDACRREILPPRPKHLATWNTIGHLRRSGFNVTEDLSREEGDRLCAYLVEKRWWPIVPENTPLNLLESLGAARYFEMGSGDRSAVLEARAAILDYALKSGAKADFSGTPRVRHFYTKVAGVTHQNDDGTDRQTIIARCAPFENLRVEHDEGNTHDPNAMKVLTQLGDQIGFLSREVAQDMCWKAKHDFGTAAMVANITGGTREYPTLGMNILVVVARPDVSDAEAQAYLDRITPDVLADSRLKRSSNADLL